MTEPREQANPTETIYSQALVVIVGWLDHQLPHMLDRIEVWAADALTASRGAAAMRPGAD